MTEYTATCCNIPCDSRAVFTVTAATEQEAISTAEEVLKRNNLHTCFFVDKVEAKQ